MELRKAGRKDAWGILALALLLWPEHDTDSLFDEISNALEGPETAFFVAISEKAIIGFAECTLRHDYVEGARTSPVGYLEGIFVKEKNRGQGVARALVGACEAWAKALGCTEFASDCLLQNTESIAFHHRVGFGEANRIVCFLKKV